LKPFTLNDITLSITSLARPKELERTIEYIKELPHIQVILNGANVDAYQRLIRKFASHIRFIINKKNIGVAAAWNQGIVVSNTQFTVLSSDDLEYPQGWTDTLLMAINKNDGFLQFSLSDPMSFSSFCVDKRLIAEQGWFDQNFPLAYYEDEDWYLRFRERHCLYNNPKPYEEIIPRLKVVIRHPHAVKWKIIPINRYYFEMKWKKLKNPDLKCLHSRENVQYQRRIKEPVWPELEKIRQHYLNGNFSSRLWIYDKPSLSIQILIKLAQSRLIVVVFFTLKTIAQRIKNW
jgi:glycosyltransferase involved in cell wall biosynthesis